MGEYVEIIKKLDEYVKLKEKGIVKKKIFIGERDLLRLEDRILKVGLIFDEDFEKQIYLILIMAGAWDMNPAFIGIQLKDGELLMAGYAREGLIKQHTVEKAIAKLEKVL